MVLPGVRVRHMAVNRSVDGERHRGLFPFMKYPR